MRGARLAVALSAVATAAFGCRATTGRPHFDPFPEAEHVEIGFGAIDRNATVMQITDTVLAYLQADSITFTRVRRFDGYLESAWLDAETLQPTDRRPLGSNTIRVRVWVDPTMPGYGRVEAETIYNVMADPSRPFRELERPVDPAHAVNRRIGDVLKRLGTLYGAPTDSVATAPPGTPPPGAPPVPPDTAARDTTARPVPPPLPDSVPTDTTRRPAPAPSPLPDSVPTDTTRHPALEPSPSPPSLPFPGRD